MTEQNYKADIFNDKNYSGKWYLDILVIHISLLTPFTFYIILKCFIGDNTNMLLSTAFLLIITILYYVRIYFYANQNKENLHIVQEHL